jgi:AraC-like DNA-binding protein
VGKLNNKVALSTGGASGIGLADGGGAADTASRAAVGGLFLLALMVGAALRYSIAGSGTHALTSGLNYFMCACVVLTEDPLRFQAGLGSDVLRRVVAHVEANLGEHISLDQLAALAGMSRFHFARQFRISTGHSPMGYVRHARIERATAILRERNITIARVAVSLGFADQSHFTRTFGRFIGVSPKSFADRHRMRARRTSASSMTEFGPSW